MPISLTSEAVVFAINAAIRLGTNIRHAYVNSLRSQKLLLPLPSFDERPNLNTVHNFFKDEGPGHLFRLGIERLQYLYETYETLGLPTDAEKEEYKNYYVTIVRTKLGLDNPYEPNEPAVSFDDVVALLKIRQWEKGKVPHPSGLQLVAGTLVELGVDYFRQTPGALNTESAYGRAIQHFLEAFDHIRFSDDENLKRTLAQDLLPRLFIAGAESIEELSPEWLQDPELLEFIQYTAGGLSEDLLHRMSEAEAGDREEIVQWGQMVLSSLVRNGGTYVFAAPGNLFKVSPTESKLIQSTGLALLGIILDEDSDTLRLKEAFDLESIDRVVRAALAVVAEYPEMITKHEGLRTIIAEVSFALASTGINRPDLIPEFVRLVLFYTGQNLHLLWDIEEENGEHLLIDALRELLMALAHNPDASTWRLRLSKAQIVELVDWLIAEVVDNPAWITDRIEESSLLTLVVESTLNALEQIPPEQRLTFDTLRQVLSINLRAVASSKALLDQIEWGIEEATEANILEATMELAIHHIFRHPRNYGVDKVTLLLELLRYLTDAVLQRYPDQRGFFLVHVLLKSDNGLEFYRNFDQKRAAQMLEALLELVIAYPEVISREEDIQDAFTEVATLLMEAGIQEPDFLGEVVRLLLRKAVMRIELLLPDAVEGGRALLLTAMREILLTVSEASPPDERWYPGLSSDQLVELISFLLDEVVENPDWITRQFERESLLRAVLHSTIVVLRNVPPHQRLSFAVLAEIIRNNLYLVARHPALLDRIQLNPDDQQEAVLLTQILNIVFIHVYQEVGRSALRKKNLLLNLLSLVADTIIPHFPNRKGLVITQIVLSEAAEMDFSTSEGETIGRQMLEAILDITRKRPELVTRSPYLQDLLADIAMLLSRNNIQDQRLRPALVSQIMQVTAGHLDFLLPTASGSYENLALDAFQQILSSFDYHLEQDSWVRTLSNEQLLHLLDNLLAQVLANPEWIDYDDFLATVIRAVRRAIEQEQYRNRIPVIIGTLFIQKTLEVAFGNPNLLIKIQVADLVNETFAIAYLLEQFLDLLFSDNRILRRIFPPKTIEPVYEAYLKDIAQGPINRATIDAAKQRFAPLLADWSQQRIDRAAFFNAIQ